MDILAGFDRDLDRAEVVKRLVAESALTPDYYFLIIISSLITTMGLIQDNSSVVIGGMLISPLLTPLLALGLGIITNNRASIARSFINIGKSIGVVLAVSFVTSFIIGVRDPVGVEILDRSAVSLPFLYIAMLSGIAATYAWIKPKISASLPGIAVAIALVPPLCVTGIGVSMFSREVFTGSLQLFFVNIIGIVGTATVLFSLFGFHDMRQQEELELTQEQVAQQKKRQLEGLSQPQK